MSTDQTNQILAMFGQQAPAPAAISPQLAQLLAQAQAFGQPAPAPAPAAINPQLAQMLAQAQAFGQQAPAPAPAPAAINPQLQQLLIQAMSGHAAAPMLPSPGAGMFGQADSLAAFAGVKNLAGLSPEILASLNTDQFNRIAGGLDLASQPGAPQGRSAGV